MPIPKPNKGEEKSVFLSRCMKDGVMNGEYPDNKQRSAICYSSWRSSVEGKSLSNHHCESVFVKQTVTFDGREHILAPVVLLVEGVHTNARGVSTLFTKDELSRYPFKWNGVPVVVFHPKKGDNFVSANTPEVMEKTKMGYLFDVEYLETGGLGRLKGTIYLDVKKAQSIYPSLLSSIEKEEEGLDVSVGMFYDDEISSSVGSWNEKPYSVIAKDIIPDHLAILPGMKGACSWEDGCGIRNNQQKGEHYMSVRSERVDKIISGSCSIYTEEHRPWLESLEECPLGKVENTIAKIAVLSSSNSELESKIAVLSSSNSELESKVAALSSSNSELESKVAVLSSSNSELESKVVALSSGPKPDEERTEKEETLSSSALTIDQYIAKAPPELQGVLMDGIERRRRYKDDLIRTIKDNGGNHFSNLEGMDLGLLEDISRAVVPMNFSGKSIAGAKYNVPVLEVQSCFSGNGGK